MMEEKKYDIVFSFDTTGSMSTCIKQVRKNLINITKRLFAEIPGMRIGIIAHGDYCDEKTSYLMKHIDLTTDVAKLVEFVNSVKDTCGGDYPEAYEYVLNKAQTLSWDSKSLRALVMIGDATPHEPNDNPLKLDWRNEVEEINRMGINIYSVQALYSGNGESYTFYKQMASKTNGYHLFLSQFASISDVFIAVCLKQHSNEKVEKYEQEMISKLGTLSNSMKTLFNTILNRKGPNVEINNAIDDVKAYDPDDDKINPCPPAKYQILNVDDNCTIKNYVADNGLVFKVGKGFYEFTKPETIQPSKLVVLQNKVTGDLYEGKKARRLAKIGDVGKKYKPTDLPEYRIFIQSTSANRKLVGGTLFLYEANDWR